MSVDEDSSSDHSGAKELTREEARKLREHYLALAKKNAPHDDEIDSADSTLATLILPGG